MTDAQSRWLKINLWNRAGRGRRSTPTLAALALLGALLTLLAGCGSQAGAWRLIGPGGGANVYSVVADPHIAGLIYAGGDNGAVYRGRADQSGRVVNGAGIPQSAIVASVLPDPAHAGVIFAGTSTGLYRSKHYGDQWSAFGAGLPSGNAAVALAATPDDAVMLAGIDHGGLFRSVNAGATWAASGAGLPAQATPVALTWDAHDHLWLLGLISGGATPLYASADDGQTWAERANGLAGAQVNALATLGASTSTPMIFAATTRGLFRSADTGQHWTSVAGGLPQGSALALATLAQQPTWVYVSIVSAVYRSTDGGARWTLVAPGLTSAAQGLAVTDDTQSGPVVFAAAGQLARYPTGVSAGSDLPGYVALTLALLALIGGGYLLSRRARRFGYAMGALRNERNTGRAAEVADRWRGPSSAGATSGAPSTQRGAETAGERASEGRVLAPTDLTSRATTGSPAKRDKAAQNGHGQPRRRG